MTPPSRDVARHWHIQHGWSLVADGDDIDIYTRSDDGELFCVRVLDCDGVRLAHNYVMPAALVVRTVAHQLALDAGSTA